MNTELWGAELLNLVAEPNYRPVKPRVLAKKLGVAEDDKTDFKRFIKKLVKRGKLSWGASHLVGPPSTVTAPVGGAPPVTEKKRTGPPGTITGTFRRAQGGF